MIAYATLSQLKASMQLSATSTTYDALLRRALRDASRLIEGEAGRTFYPRLATKDLDGCGAAALWLDEYLLEIKSLAVSSDLGRNYTALNTATDVWLSDGVRYDEPPFQLLVLNPNGSQVVFYRQPRAVRIAGFWGWHGRYADAWVSTGETVGNGAWAANATQLTVTANALDAWGDALLFESGQLLRVDDELVLVTQATPDGGTEEAPAGELTVQRGLYGTTAVAHPAGTALRLWSPDDLVHRATLTQAGRWYKRGLQGWADAGGSAELGQVWVKKLDPDVAEMLFGGGLRRLTVG